MLKNFKLLTLKLANADLILKRVINDSLAQIPTITAQIKKAFRVIYRYHMSKKRIIFIGNPAYINQQLTSMLKKTKHVFIPQSAWVAGHIADRFKRSTRMAHKRPKIKLFSIKNLKKKSDLAIIVNQFEDPIAFQENHSAKIPVITLNNTKGILDGASDYQISAKLAYLKSEIPELLFYSVLLSVFKKANSNKNKLYSTRKLNAYKKRLNIHLKGRYRKKWRNNTIVNNTLVKKTNNTAVNNTLVKKTNNTAVKKTNNTAVKKTNNTLVKKTNNTAVNNTLVKKTNNTAVNNTLVKKTI